MAQEHLTPREARLLSDLRALSEETGIPVWGTCGCPEVLEAFEEYAAAHDLDERYIGKKYPIEVMMHRSWEKFLKEGL